MGDDQIRLTRYVNAPPETVFSFLTSSEKWSMWQGVAASIDARPGGVFTMRAPNDRTASGEVVEVIPNRSITLTWGWEGHPGLPPGTTTVSIELAAQGDGTMITLTHSGLPVSEMDIHRRGWGHYLQRLSKVAEGTDVGPDPGLV